MHLSLSLFRFCVLVLSSRFRTMHDTVLMVIVCKEETSSLPSPSPTHPVCLLIPVHTPNATPSRPNGLVTAQHHRTNYLVEIFAVESRLKTKRQRLHGVCRAQAITFHQGCFLLLLLVFSCASSACPVSVYFKQVSKTLIPRKQWRLSGPALWHVCKVAGKQSHRTGQTGSPGLTLSESLIHLQVLFPFAVCHFMRKSH